MPDISLPPYLFSMLITPLISFDITLRRYMF